MAVFLTPVTGAAAVPDTGHDLSNQQLSPAFSAVDVRPDTVSPQRSSLLRRSVAAPEAACSSGWEITPTAAFTGASGGSTLGDISALSPSDIWAVGTRPSDAGITTLTEHWDGTSWAITPSPGARQLDNGLNAVDAVNSDDVWAVGYLRRPSMLFKTLALHWDGSTWRSVATRNPGASNATLVDVDAIGPADIWTVGSRFDGSSYRPLAQHWDGSSWSVVPTPRAGTGDAGLMAVAALSSNDVWAAGYTSSPSSRVRPLLEHWNGQRWSTAALGGYAGATISGLSAGAGGIWAVGNIYDGRRYVPFSARWDGASWSVEPTPAVSGPFSMLRKVATVSSSDAWAAGVAYDQSAGGFITFIQHWDGLNWSVVQTPNGSTLGTKKNELIGIGTVPGSAEIWAVGGYGTKTLAMRACPSLAATSGRFEHTSSPPPTQGDRGPDIRATRSRRATSVRDDSAIVAQASAASAPSVFATNEAAAAGISESTRTWSADITDFNDDGWPDIFLGRHQWPARVYLNDAGHFTEVDEGTIANADRHDCKAIDVDGDGQPDIFCSVGAGRGTRVKFNDLRIQGPGVTFSKAIDTSGLMDPFGRGRRISVLDANGDGYPDLFVGNEEFRPDGLPAPSRLFLNDGAGHFSDAPEYGLNQEIGSDCATSNDYNGDGWQDLIVCTALRGLRLYRNDAGEGFTDVTAASGLAGTTALDATLSDMNIDGDLDVVEVVEGELRVLLQQSDGTFSPGYSHPLTAPSWVATADANGDSAPDMYVVQGELNGTNEPDLMLMNDGLGATFTETEIPQTTSGSGDVVYPIDYDRNGLADFLVGNGRDEDNIGPIQLISFHAEPMGG